MKQLPMVYIFEGGDVCGKTTQLESIADNKDFIKGRNVYKFKFPNKIVNIKPYIDGNKYFCDPIYNDILIKDLTYLYNNKIITYDTCDSWCNVYSIFDALHKYIFNGSIEDIIKNFDIIVKLIEVDILINSIDKFEWVINEYKNIVNNDPNSVIFIDRFLESGNIYNTILPTQYIMRLIKSNGFYKYNHYCSNLINRLHRLEKFSKRISHTIYENIKNINIDREYNNDQNDEVEVEFKSKFEIPNFVTLIFNSSTILYKKFKLEINNANNFIINREISQYDTNEILRQIVSDEFNKIRCDNMYWFRVDTDYLLKSYFRETGCDFINLDEFCINYCTKTIIQYLN